MAAPKINLPTIGKHTPSTSRVTNPFACNMRKMPPAGPKDITPFLFSYLPLDRTYSSVWSGRNIFRFQIYKEKLVSGRICRAYDGKRLIIEVGCDTIIYLHINPLSPTHHKFLIESSKEFFSDITDRLTASIVVQKTRGIETIAKYETYFILGMFSTVSLGMWLLVTGSDITVTLATNKSKIDAYRKLAATLMLESNKIEKYAPVLHEKLMEFISSQATATATQTAKNLPEHIVKNKDAQAQVAGVLYGKYSMSASTFNVWTLLSTILIQAVVKSVTNTPDTLKETFDARYVSIIRELRNMDWGNPAELDNTLKKLRMIMKDSKIDISSHDLKAIMLEVKSHPRELEKSILNIYNAFQVFIAKKH